MAFVKGKPTSICAFAMMLVLVTACAPLSTFPSSSQPSSQGAGNGLIGWPFDTTQDNWFIENGYNWTTNNGGGDSADHGCSTLYESCYELDSFDFQRRGPAGSTAGQQVINPATGSVLDIGSAVGGAGECLRISIDGQAGYYVLVCHVDHPRTGHLDRGQPLGTVNTNADYGDHIHMTLYFNASSDDSAQNASHRQAVPFGDPWQLGGCSYPATGGQNEWRGTSVPCDTSPSTNPIPIPTAPAPAPTPTPTRDPLLACRSVPGFAHDPPAAPVGDGFTYATVPLPRGSVGHVDKVYSTPPGGGHPFTYDFQIVDVCSPALTADGVRAFFAREMLASGLWRRSDIFPYNSDETRACGDPYCWFTGGDPRREADTFVWASLESVKPATGAVIYQVRTAFRGMEIPNG